MNLFIKLLFFVVVQRLFLDTIFAQQLESGGGNGSNGNVTILGEHVGNSGVDLFGAQLLADPSNQKSNVGEKDGENVRFIGPGAINLTLNDGLVFQVCSRCVGSVHICYQSRTTPDSTMKGDCPESSQCSLQIDGAPRTANMAGYIRFRPGDVPYSKPDSGRVCGGIAIKGGTSEFKNSTHTLASNIPTCQPKIENDVIQLFIKTTKDDADNCQVEALKAKIKFPEIVTTPKPSLVQPSSTPAPSKPSDSTAESSFPVWAIIVIGVGFLLVIIAVGIMVYCCWKERQSSKSPVSSAFEAPLAVVTRDNAKESTVSTQAQAPSEQDPKIGKPEPTLSQEPVKKPHVDEKKTSTKPEKKPVKEKKTTIEPTTTEELAPLEDAFDKNRLARVESVADSLEEAQKEWLKKKNEFRAKGAGGKRKKKSSKKQH